MSHRNRRRLGNIETSLVDPEVDAGLAAAQAASYAEGHSAGFKDGAVKATFICAGLAIVGALIYSVAKDA